MPKPSDALVCVGRIVSVHGIKGQLKLRSYTQNPKSIFDYAPLTDRNGRIFNFRHITGSDEVMIVSVDGVTERNQADALRDKDLFVPREVFPDLVEEEFYYTDLIGLRVVDNESSEELGVVKAIHDFGAGDMLEVKFNDMLAHEYFMFTKENFPLINIPSNLITFNRPEEIRASSEASSN